MKPIKSQQGSIVLEVALGVLVLVGVGFGAYEAHSASSANKKLSAKSSAVTATKPSSSTKAVAVPAATPSDTDLIIAAVKAKGIANASGGTDPVTSVQIENIVGDNARGSAHGSTPSGFGFVAHKSGGQWSVVYEGQEAPGSDIGQQYNLPSDWYTSD